MEEQDFITISNYIGKVNNGIAIDLSLKIKDEIYQMIYWFDKEDNYKMTIDDKFLKQYKISNIYQYKNYNKLAYYIHTFVIKEKDELFNTFNL